jgi:uncharacterized membrane protein
MDIPQAQPPPRGVFAPVIDEIEGAEVLDAPAEAVGASVRRLTSPRALKEALSGTWLGHAVHPLLTDLVIGSFVSATVLDVIGPRGGGGAAASQRLIAVGIAAYPPTALTGANDWADVERADGAVRRAGLVHAATNAGALSLYIASFAARRRGAHGRGVVLGLGGAGALGFAAFLGGHLSFAKGVGVEREETVAAG